MRARVPGDVAATKKRKERVVDVKHMTQRNSARVSSANKGNSGGFSLMRQTCAAPLWATCVGPHRAWPRGPRRRPDWAAPLELGRVVVFRFPISSKM